MVGSVAVSAMFVTVTRPLLYRASGHLFCGCRREKRGLGTDRNLPLVLGSRRTASRPQAAEVAAFLPSLVEDPDPFDPDPDEVAEPLSEPEPVWEVVEEEPDSLVADPEESVVSEEPLPEVTAAGSFFAAAEPVSERESVR